MRKCVEESDDIFLTKFLKVKNVISGVCCSKTVQYCRVPKNGGRRSQPGSFLFFTTSANLVLILQSVFGSRRLACSAQTVCDDASWAGNAAETFQTVEVEAFRSPSNAAEEVVFTANALCVWWTVLNSFFQPGSFLFLGEIPAWPFFGKPFFGTRQYCTLPVAGEEVTNRDRNECFTVTWSFSHEWFSGGTEHRD